MSKMLHRCGEKMQENSEMEQLWKQYIGTNRHYERFFNLGVTVYKYRIFIGLTQEELAEKACISKDLVKCLENQQIAPSWIIAIFDLADALGIEPKQLFEKADDGAHLTPYIVPYEST